VYMTTVALPPTQRQSSIAASFRVVAWLSGKGGMVKSTTSNPVSTEMGDLSRVHRLRI